MKRRGFTSLLKSIFLVQLFVVVVIIGVVGNFLNIPLPSLKLANIGELQLFSRIVIDENMAVQMFRDSSLIPGEANLAVLEPDYLDEVFPQSLLTASIQALAYTASISGDEPLIELEDCDSVDISIPDPMPSQLKDTKPKAGKILLYCTHSAESYIPNEGTARVDGKRGLINQVAQRLNAELRENNLDSEFIDTIHDWPDYLISYSNSRNTIKDFLDKNKQVIAILDIHRDSIPGSTVGYTVNINGKKCAPILIIVGTDERKPHPQWKQNMDFAQALYRTAEEKYPGLIKGVRPKEGTYNQEYHTHALLLEFGTDHSTLAEAQYAAVLFSDVLAEVLRQEGAF